MFFKINFASIDCARKYNDNHYCLHVAMMQRGRRGGGGDSTHAQTCRESCY